MKQVAIVVLAGSILCSGIAHGQVAPDFEPERTVSGRPDFHGIWTSRWLTPLERPAEFDSLIITPEQAEKFVGELLVRMADPSQMDPELAFPDADSLAIVQGEYRSSLVVAPDDGKMPMTPVGRKAMFSYVSGIDGPEQRMSTERCMGGVGWAPLQIRNASMIRQIVQTDGHFVIHSEAYSDLRVIGVDAQRLPAAVQHPTGDSIGWWEGDVFVVETKNFDPQYATHGIVTVLSPDAEITEPFELVAPDELLYRYTVVDPEFYSEPWTVEYSFTRSDERIYEFACHEGNYSMEGMLAGARYEERQAQ